jgi:hypothetical protein
MPVHDEGKSTWKELEALEDVVMETQTYGSLFREPLTPASATLIATANLDKPISIKTGQSWNRKVIHHTHDVLVCYTISICMLPFLNFLNHVFIDPK